MNPYTNDGSTTCTPKPLVCPICRTAVSIKIRRFSPARNVSKRVRPFPSQAWMRTLPFWRSYAVISLFGW